MCDKKIEERKELIVRRTTSIQTSRFSPQKSKNFDAAPKDFVTLYLKMAEAGEGVASEDLGLRIDSKTKMDFGKQQVVKAMTRAVKTKQGRARRIALRKFQQISCCSCWLATTLPPTRFHMCHTNWRCIRRRKRNYAKKSTRCMRSSMCAFSLRQMHSTMSNCRMAFISPIFVTNLFFCRASGVMRRFRSFHTWI